MFVEQWRMNGKRPLESARYHCLTNSSSLKALSPKGTTRGPIMPARVGIFLIASPIIVLDWLKEYDDDDDDDEDEQDVLFGGVNHLPLWYFRGLL